MVYFIEILKKYELLILCHMSIEHLAMIVDYNEF